MTYREWMVENHPDKVSSEFQGGCAGCPSDYFEIPQCDNDEYCDNETCLACWGREIPLGVALIDVASSGSEDHEDLAPGVTTRAGILRDAERAVCGHREQDYGTPEDNFTVIARMWEAYLNIEIKAEDVAMMMCLFKIGRIMTGTATKDSFVDLAGYAACGAEIALGSDIDAQTMAEL